MTVDLKRTPLFEEHRSLGGKLVPFAGYEMPVQYPTGITAEHRAVRERCGLFDVSHMGEFILTGPQALDLVQRVSVNDASKVEVGQAQYSAMCHEGGGIIDDLLIYRFQGNFMLVVNAANLAKDLEWLEAQARGLEVEITDRSENTALLALQGPLAREVLARLTDHDLESIRYYRFAEGEVAGAQCVISATGYTGEDGFELYLESDDAAGVWSALLEAGSDSGLIPAGLGARDTLRLEAGYALYGNDLDEQHTPLEAGLGWITKLEGRDFVGRDALVAQKAAGVPNKLIGLRLLERGFPRPGYTIEADGQPVGTVTSGVLSPTLGVGIAMGYVPTAHAELGGTLHIPIRDRTVPAEVVKPRFYTEGSIKR